MLFKRIHIEITNICNLQCSFCPEVEREKGVMALTHFRDLLKQAVPLTERVCLHLMGEPLTHPEFASVLEIGNELGAKFNLVTNGLLLKKWARQIADSSSVAQVNISLQIHGDNFAGRDPGPYLNSVLQLVTLLEEERPDVYVNFRLWNQGIVDPQNEIIFKTLEHKYQENLPRAVDVRFKKGVSLRGRSYLHFDSRFDWPTMELENQGEVGFCYGLKNHIGILTDGSVVPCCLDKEGVMTIGNALETPLLEVLGMKRALDMKAGFERGERVESFCQHCSFINRFNKKARLLRSKARSLEVGL